VKGAKFVVIKSLKGGVESVEEKVCVKIAKMFQEMRNMMDIVFDVLCIYFQK
jgi:hypothetical protein